MREPLMDVPRRILFAEDNPADVLMLREGFRAAGFDDEIVVAEDGLQAIDALYGRGKYAGTPPPDLVLLDLALPKKDGRAVLAEIKSDPALRGIPVLILTSGIPEEEIARIYESHCNCVVRKPIDLEGYLETVREVGTFWLRVVRLPRHADLDG